MSKRLKYEPSSEPLHISVQYGSSGFGVKGYLACELGLGHGRALLGALPIRTRSAGYESGYGYCLPPYDTAYRSALRTTRTRTTTRVKGYLVNELGLAHGRALFGALRQLVAHYLRGRST